MNVINQDLAIEKLKSGLPIIFQTDTVPAIGCLPKFSEVIYKKKKRDRNKPLILMGAEELQLKKFVNEVAIEDFENISSNYWPGPLTMVMPISEKMRSFSTSRNFTVGIRIPDSLMAKSLLKQSGPLLTSSANLSGFKTANNAEEISIDLPGVDILGPLPWKKSSGKASTIISWRNPGSWELIREGEISISGVC